MPASSRHFLIPDLAATRRAIKTARGLSRKPLDLLYSCLEPDPQRSPRDVYDLHWTAVHLLTGDKAAAHKAREAVWIEAMEGGPATRPGHSWNNANFLKMHLWIASAMAAHIAIAMDWLACEGVFGQAQIRAMGESFVSTFWTTIYPHLKGRGRAPIYVEPMNQDAAMVAGCLVIGHLFGNKWMRDRRAQRMYADARVMAGNLMAQFYETGFDNDGFTYMRIIQAPVLALISMVIEEVEGVDYYNTEFPPNRFSVAKFMDKLHRFTLPSGYSFPHGRYGYVTDWNVYSQSYAARKSGDPKYLELALGTTQTSFITPWIAMDLPLAVMWTPYGTMPGTPRKLISVPYETWHDPLIWSNLALPQHRIFAQLSWRKGQHGTFTVEQDDERCVLQAGDGAERCNGFRFVDVNEGRESGHDFEFLSIGGMQASSVNLTGQWDPQTITDYRKVLIAFDDATIVSIDQYSASRTVASVYQVTTVNTLRKNTMRSERGKGSVQVFCSSPNLETTESHLGKRGAPVFQYISAREPAMSGFAALVVNFDAKKTITAFDSDGGRVRWRKRGKAFALSPNLHFPARSEIAKGRATDARFELTVGKTLYLWDSRRWSSGNDRLYSTCRVNFCHDAQTIRIDKIPYGNYVRYTARGIDVSILRGTGYDIYVDAGSPHTLILPRPQEVTFVQVNGEAVKPEYADDRVVVRIHRTAAKTPVKDPVLTIDLDKASLLSGLNLVLTRHRTALLGGVRELLSHDDTYVRLVAAEVLGWLGGESDAELVLEKMIEESHRTSPLNGLGAPWFGKWAFFSTVTVMADAVRRLGNTAVIEKLQVALGMQTEPHAKESIKTAISTLQDLK